MSTFTKIYVPVKNFDENMEYISAGYTKDYRVKFMVKTGDEINYYKSNEPVTKQFIKQLEEEFRDDLIDMHKNYSKIAFHEEKSLDELEIPLLLCLGIVLTNFQDEELTDAFKGLTEFLYESYYFNVEKLDFEKEGKNDANLQHVYQLWDYQTKNGLKNDVNLILKFAESSDTDPIIIILKGERQSGKSSFLNAVFNKKKCIMFKEDDAVDMEKSLTDFENSNMALFSRINLFNHIKFEDYYDNKVTYFLTRFHNICIFEFNLDEKIPDWLLNSAVYIIEFQGASKNYIRRRVDDICEKKNIGLNQEEKDNIINRIFTQRIHFPTIDFYINKLLNAKKYNIVCSQKKTLSELNSACDRRIFDIDEAKQEFLIDTIDAKIEEFSINFALQEKQNSELLAIKKVLERYNKPISSYTVTSDFLSRLEKLLDHFPNLDNGKEALLSYCKNSFYLKKTKEFSLCNVLIVGEPGTGKTFFAKEFARLQGQNDVPVISLAGATNFDLTGIQRSYKDAREGAILKSFLRNSTDDAIVDNFIVIFDEVEKSFHENSTEYRNLNGVLCDVLEPSTAKSLRDNYLEIRYDFSRTVKIATANSLAPIPDFILSRFPVILYMRPYTDREMESIVIPNIYKRFRCAYNPDMLPDNLCPLACHYINKLAQGQPRKIEWAIHLFCSQTRRQDNYHTMEMSEAQFDSVFKNISSADKSLAKVGFSLEL